MRHAIQEIDPAAVLDDVEREYKAANPRSLAQVKIASFYLAGGNTRVALHYDPFPIVVDRAECSRIHDLDGHVYIDFMNDLTAGLYGHSNSTIINAVHSALERGISFGAPSVHEQRLAEAICGRFPSIERVRFCNSGTEANLVALQLARAVTGRSMVLGFSGGYHGSLASFVPTLTELNVDPDRILLAEFNDIDSVTNAALRAGPDLAAIVVEPMMGSGGTILADDAFLFALRRLADATGALLIFDEVQTARLSYGGLQEVFGVQPDLTTLGKFVGGGLSFGAIGGRADIIDRFDPSRPGRIGHGGTFNNNVLTMVAGYTGLVEVATREALDTLNRRADRLRTALQVAARSHGFPLQAGGYGSIVSIHFQRVAPRNPSDITTSPVWRKLMHLSLLLRGLYTTRRGTINLSFDTSDVDCDALVDGVTGVFGNYGGVFATLHRVQ